MKKGKVLFIDTAHDELAIRLQKQGFRCDFFKDYNRDDYLKIVGDYDGIIIRSKIKLDDSFLSECKQLKFIGRVGAGMENIDVESALKKGIVCINAPEGNRDAVGEHAIGMLLALFNKIIIADKEVRKGIWIREGNRGHEIGGKIIGIIGYGNTGAAFAKKLSGFDAEVIAYDKYKSDYSDNFVRESNMQELFEKCDIISLHVPLTEETKYLVNSDFLRKFKKNIYLINTSRGKVLDTVSLIEMLNNGKVIGACLDVLEYEGLSFEEVMLPSEIQALVTKENVVLSPHIAGWTHESNYKMAVTIANKVEKLGL